MIGQKSYYQNPRENNVCLIPLGVFVLSCIFVSQYSGPSACSVSALPLADLHRILPAGETLSFFLIYLFYYLSFLLGPRILHMLGSALPLRYIPRPYDPFTHCILFFKSSQEAWNVSTVPFFFFLF
jgi:hypothetical protein